MSNMLPEGIVLDELQVDVTGIRGGYRRDSMPVQRRLVGSMEGTASDEAQIRHFVELIRQRPPFDEVRRGFTALEENGDQVYTRFSLDFEVEMISSRRLRSPPAPAALSSADMRLSFESRN